MTAQSDTQPGRLEPTPVPRRDFLGIAGLFSAGLAICAALLGMLRLPKPRVTPDASSRFRIGRAEDFPPGSDTEVPGRNVRILSTAEGLAAMSLICTHLGCIAGRAEEGFHCPCHGSLFDDAGAVLGGPAPRALKWFKLSQTVDGTLVVDSAVEVPPETRYEPVTSSADAGPRRAV